MSTVKVEHLGHPWQTLTTPCQQLQLTRARRKPEGTAQSVTDIWNMDLVNFHNGSSQSSLIFYINICNFLAQLLSYFPSLPRFQQVQELYLLHNELFLCR